MSKSKLFIWIIILAIIVTVLIQNKTVFLDKQAIGIDLYFKAYKTPELPLAVYFLVTLVIGLIVSYLFNLSNKWRARKKIKGLTATLDSQREELASLKQEMETLKNKPPEAPVPSFAPQMDAASTGETEPKLETQENAQMEAQTEEAQSETDQTQKSEEDEKK
jgi:uncharacterized integral membrane protein